MLSLQRDSIRQLVKGEKKLMPSQNLLQILFSSLPDSPIVAEVAAKAGGKAFSIVKAYYADSADLINGAYQNSYGYALGAICIGVADDKIAFTQKMFNAKITREFAEKIDSHYFQPFVLEFGWKSDDLAAFRKQTVKALKEFAKHKDKIFQIEEITEEDLAAFISYRDSFAITDLVLAQMRQIAKVDDTLAAFLSFNELLGDAVLFFFRELIRKDERLDKTQAALQREGLCIEVRNLQAAIKTAHDDFNQAAANHSTNLVELAQQLQHLQQIETAWNARHEQLIRFSQRFENQLEELLGWAQAVYSTLDKIEERLEDTQAEVKEIKNLAENILQILKEVMKRQSLSAQVKPRDEFTQHNDTSLKLIREAVALLKHLSPQHPEYSRVSIMAGSVLSSTGALEQAEQLFQQALDRTQNNAERALAHFNFFQVTVRRQAYTEALAHLQTAIKMDRQKYALHNVKKYPMLQLLGAGGMGCVLRCQNKNILRDGRHEQVVVKCFWESRQGAYEEVFGEAIKMRRIAGQYVPEPLDYGYTDEFKEERAFFVTEYLDGAIDGETWLETHGPLDLTMGLQVGMQIAEGLQVAHEAGIYHLDLKPANILLLKNTSDVSKTSDVSISVKIIDFGLSKAATSLRQEAITVQQSRPGLSMFGQAIFGTLDYAPPEQRGYSDYGKPSAKSDIFAFGKTLYRLLTNEKPIEIEPEFLEHAPDWFKLLSSCTRANPVKRPSSAQELVNRLTAMGAVSHTKQHTAQQSAKAEQNRQAEQKAEVEQKRQAEIAKRLAAEEQDEKAWQAARQQNTKSAYQRYLNGDTLKKHADEAKKCLQAFASYRYIDNGDGTVTDTRSGLVWLKKANCFGEQDWEEAMQSATKLADGQCGLRDGSKAGDWRLPTQEEWKAMIDTSYSNPVLSNAASAGKWAEGDAFLGVKSSWYWSSSTRANGAGDAWVVNIGYGSVHNFDETSTHYVWPVKGGH
jgi:serine/threonine protein kinase/archaellum component FlaC